MAALWDESPAGRRFYVPSPAPTVCEPSYASGTTPCSAPCEGEPGTETPARRGHGRNHPSSVDMKRGRSYRPSLAALNPFKKNAAKPRYSYSSQCQTPLSALGNVQVAALSHSRQSPFRLFTVTFLAETFGFP